jgi:hypothetical protein
MAMTSSEEHFENSRDPVLFRSAMFVGIQFAVLPIEPQRLVMSVRKKVL